MEKMGWKELQDFNMKELVEYHLEETEKLFEELEKQNKENDSLGFITDFVRALLKEVK
jgi:cytosine/adenosine deaminase-related metal-dependent hydrolase